MPPVKPISPSTTRIFRWSRRVSFANRKRLCQGITGLNSSTLTPAFASSSNIPKSLSQEPRES